MNILLLSAYDAVSHQYWRKGLVDNFPEHNWTVLTLPARFFAWRVRGNSLSWAFNEAWQLNKKFDLIVCTSMTDLSALKGFLPQLAHVPTLVYFHENQFAYPESGHEFNRVEPQMLSIYTALAATKVVFNSEFNRQTFLLGAESLLKKMPDQVPSGLVERIASVSEVLPVPINNWPDVEYAFGHHDSDNLQLIWNHRWEFDKGPELLKCVVELLIAKQLPITLHIVGQRFRNTPDTFSDIAKLFDKNANAGCVKLATWGFVKNKTKYQRLLKKGDVVLSTAKHDFQGLSILEAVQAGCLPLVPKALAYPEIFSDEFCYQLHSNVQSTALSVVNQLECYIKCKLNNALAMPPSVEHFLWLELQASYAKLLDEVSACSAI